MRIDVDSLKGIGYGLLFCALMYWSHPMHYPPQEEGGACTTTQQGSL